MQANESKQGSFPLRAQTILALLGGGYAVSFIMSVQSYRLNRLHKDALLLVLFFGLQLVYMLSVSPKLIQFFPSFEVIIENTSRLLALAYIGLYQLINKTKNISHSNLLKSLPYYLTALILEFSVRTWIVSISH